MNARKSKVGRPHSNKTHSIASEKLNMQTGKDKSIYKNRMLIHSLK
jgi:hypothetical protein